MLCFNQDKSLKAFKKKKDLIQYVTDHPVLPQAFIEHTRAVCAYLPIFHGGVVKLTSVKCQSTLYHLSISKAHGKLSDTSFSKLPVNLFI